MVFNNFYLNHLRPFRCKMSAMVENFVHEARSYRVLEAPDSGPTSRLFAIEIWLFILLAS